MIDSVGPADALHRLAWSNPGTTMAWFKSSQPAPFLSGSAVDRRHPVKPTAEVILPTVALGV